MLVQVKPEKVGKHWPKIESLIEGAIAGRTKQPTKKLLAQVRKALNVGKLVAWFNVDDDGELKALVTTSIQEGEGGRELMIYTLTWPKTSEFMTREEAEDMIGCLKKYCKDVGCNSIVGYTNARRVIRLAEDTGGDTSTVFIRWEV